VYVRATGALTLTNTTISGNSAAGFPGGGGIFGNGSIAINNSTIRNNSAEDGGGVLCFGCDLTTTRSTISGNTGGGVAGFYNNYIEINNSTVANNTGDGIVDITPDGALTIIVTRSTISGNSEAGLNSGVAGGFEVTNSTISGNDQGIAGGERYGLGLELTHSTITRNARQGIFAAASRVTGGAITLNRSLISGNRGHEVVVEQSDNNEEASVTAGNFNVFGYGGNARITGFTLGPTDIVPNRPLDAVLNPNLANNGGFTRTHALTTGSPAIDAVFDGTCPPPAIDQRGVTRPQDGNRDGGPACDTGAFERRPSEG
jgi:hypothetical protein